MYVVLPYTIPGYRKEHCMADVRTPATHGGTTKRERLEARVSTEQKELLQHAADLQGRTLSDFVVESAQRAAEEVIRAHSVVMLSARDSRAFVEALLEPPMPNGALRTAAARYQETVEER
jgi:uncharacterized protein (DUF1778 family)